MDLNFTAWEPSQPGHPRENCAHLTRRRLNSTEKGMWFTLWLSDRVCSAYMPIVCKLTVCPEGWRFFQGNCYRFYEKRVNFTQALTNCRDIDKLSSGQSDLVSVHSDEEMNFIINLCDAWKPRWIGLTRLDFQPDSNPTSQSDQGGSVLGGSFKWTDGQPVDYTAWLPMQPDNSRGHENCVQIRIQERNYSWNDVRCDKLYSYTCKFNLTF
ncbi:echinoidin-like [Lytechinus variegatus]|uniref:echinoidin-like n=1 Tax=Lytechinus variegatus TaxID=7654 RepID=UPI001BB24288|nr:echinoidin-like [Lytechinus variegatus]